MPAEVLQKAVDPFFTTKPPGRGTGLGLSMTFGYVRQSNGELSIESELGKGTTITILMPRYEMETAPVSVS
jgi:signal transduction histidine kinase